MDGIISVLRGQRDEFELEYPCHSPTEKRWFMMTASRLRCTGDAAILIMHSNITERVLAEIDAEERYEELKVLMERRKDYETRLEDFYSTVAHDIRSPLTSVLGSISLLNGLTPAQLNDEEAKSLLESAEFASRQILALVTDFLDQRKIEQGKMEFAVTQVRAATLLRDARKMVDGLAKICGVDVAIDLEDELVVCNSDSIIRVLTNLLSNAIKFTPSGKRVYLTARRADDQHVQFMVRDEGRGMSSEVQERLFEPFAPCEASDVMAGSGLGLMVVKSMLEQHGSTPTVQSEVGTGTAISFQLRRA
jgi:signal transduction histidine kinase